MSSYFKNFPKTVYDNVPVSNITLRVDILDDLRDSPNTFLPYTIVDGETAEEIAYLYYGDAKLSWLIYLSNDILDPYTQWPMDFNNFEKTLAKKYKAQALADENKTYMSDLEIINWCRVDDNNKNIVHYEYVGDAEDDSGINHTIGRDTYLYNNDVVTGDYRVVRIYDHELAINESYRNIVLLNQQYVTAAQKNMKRLLKNG